MQNVNVGVVWLSITRADSCGAPDQANPMLKLKAAQQITKNFACCCSRNRKQKQKFYFHFAPLQLQLQFRLLFQFLHFCCCFSFPFPSLSLSPLSLTRWRWQPIFLFNSAIVRAPCESFVVKLNILAFVPMQAATLCA